MFCFLIKFCSCVDSVACFVVLLNCVAVLTVWHVLFSIKFCSCVDSVVCFVFLLNFVAVLTVWYVLFSY